MGKEAPQRQRGYEPWLRHRTLSAACRFFRPNVHHSSTRNPRNNKRRNKPAEHLRKTCEGRGAGADHAGVRGERDRSRAVRFIALPVESKTEGQVLLWPRKL